MYKEVKASERLPERSKEDNHRSDVCHGIDDVGTPRSCYYDYRDKIWRDWYPESPVSINTWLEKTPVKHVDVWLEKTPQQNAEEWLGENERGLHDYLKNVLRDTKLLPSVIKAMENYAQSVGVSEEEIEDEDKCIDCGTPTKNLSGRCFTCFEKQCNNNPEPQPKEEEKCSDKNCNKPSIGDYNGHGAYACEYHMKKWEQEFEDDYS